MVDVVHLLAKIITVYSDAGDICEKQNRGMITLEQQKVVFTMAKKRMWLCYYVIITFVVQFQDHAAKCACIELLRLMN